MGRLFWLGAGLVVLWPLAVATEFRPWTLLARLYARFEHELQGQPSALPDAPPTPAAPAVMHCR